MEEATWTADNPNLVLKNSKGKTIKIVFLGEEYEIETTQENLQKINIDKDETYYFGKLTIITEYDYDNQGNLIQKRVTEENGGINKIPRSYNSQTGLSNPIKP